MGVKSFAVWCSVEEEAGSERKEPHHPSSMPPLQNPQRSRKAGSGRLRPSEIPEGWGCKTETLRDPGRLGVED